MPAFQSYRVIHRMHLGGLDQVLEVGSILQFNGSSLRTEDGEEIKISQPSAITGAIKVGWLVPVDSSENTFAPKSAGIQVHSAKSQGEKREAVNLMTVHDEEQNIGNRKDVRNTSDRNTEKRASTQDTGEGVVVSRLKTPAKAPPIEMGSQDRAVMQSLENKTLAVEKIRLNKPTGDVSEAIAGDEIEDLLPDAEVMRPPKRAYANEGVSTSSGGSRVGGQEDGVVIGKVGSRPEIPQTRAIQAYQEEEEEDSLLPEDPTFREKALRRWAQTGKTWNGQPVSLRELSVMALTVLESLDSARKTVTPTRAPAKIQVSEASETLGGNLDWDLNQHWKTRKASLQKFAGDPDSLRKIYSLENSGGVKKAIEEILEGLQEPLS